VFTRIVIVTTLVSMAAIASAVALHVFRVPDPSIYVLAAAGVLALVMLRRRTS
jgi:MYXO-CTERM domain-containing protein